MADLQVQRRLNPTNARTEDYLSLRWVDPMTGKRKSKALGFVSQQEAQQTKRLKEAELLLQSQAASTFRDEGRPQKEAVPSPAPPRSLPPVSPTLRDWLEAHYLPIFKLDHAPSTCRQEELAASWLAELLGHVPIADLSGMHVDNYKAHRLHTRSTRTGRPASPVTVNIELRVLSSALRRAQELQILQRPLPTIKRVAVRKTPKRYLTPDEVGRLLAAARPEPGKPDGDHGTWLAILLMANLGLRRGEALTREWSDVDLDQGVLRVTHKPAIRWYVKGGRARQGPERTIPLTPVVQQALAETWITAGRPASGWIFPGGRRSGNSQAPRQEIIRGVKGAAKRAGIGVDVHPHLLRHAWASRLAMGGVDRKSLQEMGGWLDGRMLDEVYAHVTPQHLKDIMNRQGIGSIGPGGEVRKGPGRKGPGRKKKGE